MLEALIFVSVFKYKSKGSVALLQFGFYNLFKSLLLQSWMLGLLLICARFDKFLVVFVAHNRNAKGLFLLVSVVKDNL